MKVKSQKGSIAIFVLVALLFYMGFLLLLYANNLNKVQTISEKAGILKNIYGKNVNEDSINDIYNRKMAEKNEEIILPEEYQQVEYIESTGTQYINTEYLANQDTGYYIDVQLTNLNQENDIIGTINPNIGIWSYNVDGVFYFGRKLGYGETDALGTQDLERHVFTMNYFNSLKATRDEDYIQELDKEITLSNDYPVYIFASNNKNSAYAKSYVKVYNAKITSSNELTCNFIPCYRKLDNEVGLYDTVNGKFYTNQGTGEFEMGPEI